LIRGLTIKKVFEVLMPVIFTFSIAPRMMIHNFVADHKDYFSNKPGDKHKTGQVNQYRINCHAINSVAESPFTDETPAAEIVPLIYFIEKKKVPELNFFSAHHFISELRGPPQV
jgi:hypothetical protein